MTVDRDNRMKRRTLLQWYMFVITRSSEQSVDEITSEEIFRETTEYKGSIVVYDALVDDNQKTSGPFCKRKS